MFKNKVFKILIALLIALAIIISLSQNVFALKPIDTMFEGTGDKSNVSQNMTQIIGSVINIIQVVSTGIAILMLVIIGVQYIYASPSSKVQLAKTSIYYVLGAILIFAASGLLSIIKKFAITNIQNEAKKIG